MPEKQASHLKHKLYSLIPTSKKIIECKYHGGCDWHPTWKSAATVILYELWEKMHWKDVLWGLLTLTLHFFQYFLITDTAKAFSWYSKKNFSINPTKHVMRVSSANHTPEYPKQKWLDKMGIELKFFILNSVLCTLDSVPHDKCMPRNRSRGNYLRHIPSWCHRLVCRSCIVLRKDWEMTNISQPDAPEVFDLASYGTGPVRQFYQVSQV